MDSTLKNELSQDQVRSETKSKGSFGNAGSLFGKLFKKKDKDDDLHRQSSNTSNIVDITQLKGEARHLNLGPNKAYKTKVI